MLKALIKAMVTATFLVVLPIVIVLFVGILGVSWKAFLTLMTFILPFVIIGLVYGYLAGSKA